MQLRWLEDFVALADTRSFTRAAERRHVTHPAFGRRIRALEAWAGTALVERGPGAVTLTPAGEDFLQVATQTVRGLDGSRERLHSLARRQVRQVSLATGRTLARTLLADWLVRLKPVLRGAEMLIRTRALSETAQLLERGEVDFCLVYHHAALALRLDARRFAHHTLAADKLVPVARAHAQGGALHRVEGSGRPVPYLAYSPTLALGRLVEDHLANHPLAPRLAPCVECDSADALHAYVQKGLGVAWLPWSMVQAECRAGLLSSAGPASLEVRFDVRMYRPKGALGPLAESVWQAMTQR